MECSKKSYQVLKLNTGHTTIICKKFPCEKINKYKVYRVEFGHSRCIARYGDMMSVLCFCRDLVLYGVDTLTMEESKEWAKKNGSL